MFRSAGCSIVQCVCLEKQFKKFTCDYYKYYCEYSLIRLAFLNLYRIIYLTLLNKFGLVNIPNTNKSTKNRKRYFSYKKQVNKRKNLKKIRFVKIKALSIVWNVEY